MAATPNQLVQVNASALWEGSACLRFSQSPALSSGQQGCQPQVPHSQQVQSEKKKQAHNGEVTHILWGTPDDKASSPASDSGSEYDSDSLEDVLRRYADLDDVLVLASSSDEESDDEFTVGDRIPSHTTCGTGFESQPYTESSRASTVSDILWGSSSASERYGSSSASSDAVYSSFGSSDPSSVLSMDCPPRPRADGQLSGKPQMQAAAMHLAPYVNTDLCRDDEDLRQQLEEWLSERNLSLDAVLELLPNASAKEQPSSATTAHPALRQGQDEKKHKLRPCKGKRERYKKLVARINGLIEKDPDNFDLGSLELPQFVASSEAVMAKVISNVKRSSRRVKAARKAVV
jgi:hypothetical protein